MNKVIVEVHCNKDDAIMQVKLQNLDTGDVAMFKANCWLGARGDGQPYVDLPAIIKSKPQLKSKFSLPKFTQHAVFEGCYVC